MPSVVASGHFKIGLPSWGRCFWQDPNDGVLFLAYSSGDFEVDFVTSANSGVSWEAPKVAFYIDDFSFHNNFDIAMDRNGNLHCGFRFENHNCYAHLVKNGTTWDQQSPIQRPWSICADSGSVGGHNGSVYIHELNDFYSAGTATFSATFRATPQVFLTAKGQKTGGGLTAIHAARVNSPYTGVPESGYYNNDVSSVATGIPPGLDGGFPLITAAGKPGDFGGGTLAYNKQVTYNVDNTGICVAWNSEFTDFARNWTLSRANDIFKEGDPTAGGARGSGLIPDLVQGPTMGFEKGPYPFEPINSIIISTYEQDLSPSSFDKHWEMMTTAHEHTTDGNIDIDKFVRVESAGDVQGVGVLQRSLNFDEWADDVFSGGQPSNVAPALTPMSGTLCDITNGALSGIMYMYFNSRGPDGRHCVSRMLCEVEAQPQTTGPTKPLITTYRFGERFHPHSGIRNFAHVDTTLTGGKDGLGMWHGMRALHHVNGQWAAGKSEFVATVGSGLSPAISNLVAFNFNDSLEATASLKQPTWSFDHIMSSGNSNFIGLSAATIASSPGLVTNLFDQSTVTSATISNGDSLTFEWESPIILSRVEIPWNKTGFGSSDANNFFEVDIQTSMDGITFNTVKLYDGGPGREGVSTGPFLIKVYADTDLIADTFNFTTRMNCGIGKFVRILFSGPQTGTRDTREVRIYGSATTKHKTETDFNSFLRRYSRPSVNGGYVERFDGVNEFDGLPQGWRTYGDWDWLVQASGEFSKASKLPTALPTRDGTIHSGIFMGKTVGNGDGSALTSAEWIVAGTSGVVEVDISVGINEVDENGIAGRTIQWDTRYHKIGQGVILPATEEDDGFQFFIAPTGSLASSNIGEITGFHTQGSCFVGTCDYFTVKTNVAPGDYTLRWTFRRGSTINAIPIRGDQSMAYIDNVRGLNASPQPSIFGYIGAESFATGIINGFMSKTKWSYINSYIKGYYWFEPRHGYIFGAPNAFSSINGYLLGNNEGQVSGYTLGGSGLLSIPFSSVNGYIAVQSGDLKAINGYTLGMRANSIYGNMVGFDTINPASGIFGYMLVPDDASQIYGGVNLGVSGVAVGSIEGFMANRINEQVYGYLLGPPGDTSNIQGYLAPQKISSVQGYVRGLGATTGIIYSYLKVADNELNIHGYVSASGDDLVGNQQRIFGYLFNAGSISTINGYINSPDEGQIYGYMQGVEFASGSINSFVSGIDFSNSSVNGYLAGISGNAQENTNGYLIGVELPSDNINGYLIGFSTDGVCDNHGTVPFATIPSFTIPSGNFIN